MKKRTRLFILTLVIFSLFLSTVPHGNLSVASYNEQAIRKANQYLQYSSFSRSGLIRQLEFEGFSYEDSVYAVDATNTNWKDQAVKKAKSYLEYSSFSRSGLISQLEFEGFTNEEAVYGTDSTNTNWMEQAVKKAKSYLKLSGYSRSGLISQLEFEGFTNEEAVYGADVALGNIKPKKEFKDLARYEWAREAIEVMADEGIINGVSEDRFDPSSNIKRGDFVTLIARLMDLEGGDVKNLPFTDVDSAKYYAPSIAVVYDKGLINGRTETSFDPEGFITREEMSKIIGSIITENIDIVVDRTVLNKFTDSSSISSWAKDSASVVVDQEIIEGSNNMFKPKDNATRAETAVMLYRLKNNIL